MLRKPSLRSLTITVAAAAFTVPALASPESKAMYQALAADYPLTQVGQVMFDTDYTRITKPGAILAVRLPGIYADVANTKDAIVNTNYADGQLTQATGFAAAFGSTTTHSRTLNPNEKVYVTQIFVKKNAVQLELLTVDVATLGDGMSTRYRAELNVKLPGLDTMTPDDVKKTIDAVVADPAVASAVVSKTVKLGMTPNEVKQSLGNPDKIVELGPKQVFIYKDMKVILMDGKVSDVQ